MESGISIRLIDMNNFDINYETEIDMNSDILHELKEQLEKLKVVGLDFDIGNLQIKNSGSFYGWILKKIFSCYSVTDKQKDGGGIPDYLLNLKGNPNYPENHHIHRIFSEEKMPDRMWVEVKRNGDGLHYNQLHWILKNKEKERIFILFIKEETRK